MMAVLPALLVPAVAGTTAANAADRSPVVKRITPKRVFVGQTLTIHGRHFRRGLNKNTVAFKRSGAKVVFVKADKGTAKLLKVKLPKRLENVLLIQNGTPIPTRLQIRVLSTKFGKRYTSKRISPIVGAEKPPAPPKPPVADPDADCDGDGARNAIDSDDDNDLLTDAQEIGPEARPVPRRLRPRRRRGRLRVPLRPRPQRRRAPDRHGLPPVPGEAAVPERARQDRRDGRSRRRLAHPQGRVRPVEVHDQQGRHAHPERADVLGRRAVLEQGRERASEPGRRRLLEAGRVPRLGCRSRATRPSVSPTRAPRSPPGRSAATTGGSARRSTSATSTVTATLPRRRRTTTSTSTPASTTPSATRTPTASRTSGRAPAASSPSTGPPCTTRRRKYYVNYAGVRLDDEDTDGDGVRDGADDQDHDDVPNVMECSRVARPRGRRHRPQGRAREHVLGPPLARLREPVQPVPAAPRVEDLPALRDDGRRDRQVGSVQLRRDLLLDQELALYEFPPDRSGPATRRASVVS